MQNFSTSSTLAKNQKITLYDKKKIEMDGVYSILSFDEDYVKLETNMGCIIIEGEGLKIENLTKDSGSVLIVGEILSLSYTHEKQKKKKRG